MTVSSTDNKEVFPCSGLTEYSYNNKVLDEGDLVIILVDTTTDPVTETVLTITTHYTIDGTKDDNLAYPNGVTITTVSAYSSDYELVVYNDPVILQSFDHVENEAKLAEAVELVYDRLTLICQRLDEQLDRAVVFQESAPEVGVSLPTLDGNSGKVLGVKATEDGFQWLGSVTLGTVLLTSFMRTVLEGAGSGSDLAGYIDAKIEAIAGLTWAADSIMETTGVDTATVRALNTLGQLGVAGAWTHPQNYSATAKSGSSGTVTIDLATEPSVVLTISGNITLAVSNEAHGRGCELKVIQDGSGNHTLGFDTDIDAASYDVAVNDDANAVTLYTLWSDGTKTYIRKFWEDD